MPHSRASAPTVPPDSRGLCLPTRNGGLGCFVALGPVLSQLVFKAEALLSWTPHRALVDGQHRRSSARPREDRQVCLDSRQRGSCVPDSCVVTQQLPLAPLQELWPLPTAGSSRRTLRVSGMVPCSLSDALVHSSCRSSDSSRGEATPSSSEATLHSGARVLFFS